MLLEEKHELRKTRVQRKPLWGLGALWVLLYWCLYLTAVSGPQTRVCMWLQSLGHGLVLAGGEWWATVRSFVYVYSCSPSLTLPPELRLLSDQRRHRKYNMLESSQNHPPQPWSAEKLSSAKLVSGALQVEDCCSRAFSASERGGPSSWSILMRRKHSLGLCSVT